MTFLTLTFKWNAKDPQEIPRNTSDHLKFYLSLLGFFAVVLIVIVIIIRKLDIAGSQILFINSLLLFFNLDYLDNL